jgi:hypothetical protein
MDDLPFLHACMHGSCPQGVSKGIPDAGQVRGQI